MIIDYTFDKIHTIKLGSPNFTISNGLTKANRASIEITADCPDNMRNTLAFACSQGWITPVAHVTEREMIIMGLTKP